MIGISFWRILKSAFKNFWRNIWLSVATLVIMVITLLMVSFLYFANVFGGEVLRTIEQKVDLTVIFEDGVEPGVITALTTEIENRHDVESVTVVTSEQALEQFRARHSDDPLIEESLQELEDNPLPASMYILATEPRFYANIAEHLESERYQAVIAEVNYESARNVIERLISVINSVKNIGFVLTVLFAVLVVLIMFNTVRLAIYSFREEIDIMRLVGASRWFIQGPFILDAVFVSLLAVVIATAMLYPALSAAAPHLGRFFFDAGQTPFDLYTYATDNWLTIVGLQAATAVGLAIVSSAVAIRRYLRD